MKNKGYILTWDALLALTLILMTFVTLLALGYLNFSPEGNSEFERLHFLGNDVMDTLNKNGVLEEIATYWAKNDTANATETADHYLENLELVPSKFGYRLEIDGENVSERILNLPESEITAKTSSVRFISGFGFNQTSEAHVARAWLWYNDLVAGKLYSLERVWYGNSSRYSFGANWTFYYEGGAQSPDICIPQDCSGDDLHTYDGTLIETEDALDDAMFRLLYKLDTDKNGKIDLDYDTENMVFKASSIETKQLGSQLLEVKLILWV